MKYSFDVDMEAVKDSV